MPFALSKKANTIAGFALSAVIPALILCVLCAWGGIYPFGPESFLTEDFKYQYIDFFTWYKGVLAGQNSLLYSFGTGLGENAWGMFSYYLSSPFNLLIVFFDQDYMVLFAFIVTLLKLSAAGITASLYFQKRFDLSGLQSVVFSLSFVWMAWTATQLRNILWLDSMILLPLMMLGVYQLVRRGEWKMLLVSTVLSLVVCWYAAYMDILFISLLAVVELLVFAFEGNKVSAKYAAKRVALYAGVMFLALLLSAFTFVPTVMAMIGGAGSSASALDYLRVCSEKDLVGGFLFASWKVEVSPQFYAGLFPLVMAVLFVLNGQRTKKERLVILAFLAFLTLSCYLLPLYYVWCGFRVPNGFYCRIANFASIVLLWAAANEFKDFVSGKTELRSRKPIVVCAVIVVLSCAFFVLSHWLSIFYVAVFVVIGVALAGVFVLFAKAGESSRNVVLLALVVLVGIDLCCNAHSAWSQLYQGYPQAVHDEYVENSRAQLKDLANADNGTYRVDKTYTRAGLAALNEGLSMGYRALSSYSSAQDGNAISMLNNLGYSNPGEFSMRYAEPMLLTDSLFGVKYVAANNAPAGYLDMSGVVQPTQHGAFYKNPYALSLGYGVHANAVGASIDGLDNPFERQNALVSALVGQDLQLYKPIAPSAVETQGQTTSWEFQIPQGTYGYSYVLTGNGARCDLSINGQEPVQENWRFEHAVRFVGDATQASTAAKVVLAQRDEEYNAKAQKSNLDAPTCIFYALDVEKAKDVLARLAKHNAEVAVFDGGAVQATYNADQDGYVLLTVPNARGWSAMVNGQKVDALGCCDNALTVLPVSAGQNQIRMEFTPPGLLYGAVASAIGCIILIAVCVVSARRRTHTALHKRGVHRR